MKKGYEIGDYLRIWSVSFSQRFSGDIFTTRRVAARSVNEALKKARSIERRESPRIALKVSSVERGDIIDG